MFRTQLRTYGPAPAPRHDVAARLLGGALFIIFLAVVIFVLVYLINRYALHHDHTQTPAEDPLVIAKARYARGEISKAEFTALKKDLA